MPERMRGTGFSLMLTPDGFIRAQVLAIRIQLERLARDAFDVTCATTRHSSDYGQTSTRKRLVYLLAPVAADPESLATAHGLVRLGSFIYEQTSDVLHGRMSLLSVTPQLLQEWQSALQDLQALGARGRIVQDSPVASPVRADSVVDLTTMDHADSGRGLS